MISISFSNSVSEQVDERPAGNADLSCTYLFYYGMFISIRIHFFENLSGCPISVRKTSGVPSYPAHLMFDIISGSG
ncbi:MAG TPA: hypothetical protein DCZ08_06825 [Anaerolineaceae bacterium]|nr:hypothetical protein [Anaerolineaceae bacterium]